MPYISQASIQELKDRMDAVAVVSDYVQLEHRGGRYWACCPFHQEKTASFTVNPDIKTYYCFGCQKGDTVINFVQEMDKLSFPETIELLAKRFGVELVYESSSRGNHLADDEEKKKRKDELLELYHRMTGTFHHFLLKKPDFEAAKHYIISRGINIEMIERFRLGYAVPDRYWLHKFLLQKGYSREFLASSGLFSSRFPEISLFSGRLMFPISDRQGRTVAFGGRYLAEASAQEKPEGGPVKAPKYINSPELEIYKKGEILFALDLALPEIRRTKAIYVAEGYMDVIALHQAGISNALAPLGTAFTDEQARLLKRWAEKIIFFFDTDEAGQAAAMKGILTCRKNGIACALVSGGNEEAAKDPADILEKFGPEVLHKRAKCFINDFDYLLNRARALYDTSNDSAQGKARAVASLFPFMNLLDSEVARESCFQALADAFGLPVTAVADDFRRHTTMIKKEDSRQHSENKHVPIRMNDELLLLIVVAVDYVSSREERLFSKFRTTLEINEVEDPNAKEIFVALEECIRYGDTGMDELLARITSPELRTFIIERSVTKEFSVNASQLMMDGIKKIKGKRLKRRQEEIIVKLRELKKNVPGAERDSDRDLLAEKMQIDNELYLLKQGR